MRATLLLLSLLFVACGARLSPAQEQAARAGRVARTSHGMVVTVSRPASEVGQAVLARGGNAVDASIATAFALAVTWPEAGNIGGGGFMLIHPGEGRDVVCVDYRELAPAAATRTMFAEGAPSQYALVGVPGTVRGLALAHEKFGTRPWRELVEPSIKLAAEGIDVNEALADSLNDALAHRDATAELKRVFAPPEGRDSWRPGDRLVQPELAATLILIADKGADGFYRGKVAEQIVAEMERGNGLITLDDLVGYEAKIRPAVHGTFRGYDVYGAPPPSSGGICLIEMLNIVEALDLRQHERWSPTSVHLLTETMKRGFADRARHLGDSDFVEIPNHLTTKDYARKLAAKISATQATPSEKLTPEIELAGEGTQTTHFSVVDRHGMAVANTYTLEQSFGGKIVVRGAGFLLNNEMGDFNPRPGVTTRGGQIGTAANEVRPGKRMLSSMSPTIVARDGRPVLVTGSPGGRTIINTVFGIVVNRFEYGLPLAEAVAAPRLHHQWFPARLQIEAKPDQFGDLIAELERMGHTVRRRSGTQGDAHSIEIDQKTGDRIGVADQRLDGWAAGH